MAPGHKGAAAAIAVLCLLMFSSSLSPVADAQAGNGTSTPIKHLIIITMENHSFDNLFGKYPGNRSVNASNGPITVPVNLFSPGASHNLTAVAGGSFSTGNPREGYNAYHIDWNHGLMNGFLNGSGANSMKYFTSSQMAIEWDLAQQFSLGDMYFSSTLSETVPNRLYEIAGFSPVKNDYGPPPYIPYSQTVLGQLSGNGISWGYYINNTHNGIGPLSIIHGIGKHSGNIRPWSSFYSELGNNTLPSVSYLMPIDGNAGQYSQHPSSNVLIGELWLLYTVQKVMNSPEWNSTAIMINYDEGGGYYDHVAPPVVDGHQLGIRVPFMVISPYAKEDYVSSTVLSHTSTIAFIDYNWKLPALNSLVQKSGIPVDFFNFNRTYANGKVERPPLSFPSGVQALMPVSYNFGPSLYSDAGNISPLFPMAFQIPVSELPYNTTGNSSTSLYSLGSGVLVKQNSYYVPLYENEYAILIAAAAGSAGIWYAWSAALKRRRRQ